MLAKSKVRTTDYIFFIKPQLFGKKQHFSFETALIGHCFFKKNFHRDINSISDNTKAPNTKNSTKNTCYATGKAKNTRTIP